MGKTPVTVKRIVFKNVRKHIVLPCMKNEFNILGIYSNSCRPHICRACRITVDKRPAKYEIQNTFRFPTGPNKMLTNIPMQAFVVYLLNNCVNLLFSSRDSSLLNVQYHYLRSAKKNDFHLHTQQGMSI